MKEIIVALMACALIAGCSKNQTACYVCNASLSHVTVNADTVICVNQDFFTSISGGGYYNNGANPNGQNPNGYGWQCTKK